MKRQNGYYWAKMLPSYYTEGNTPEWEVCYFLDGKWFSTAYGNVDFNDTDFTDINETRILNPDEK
jgi:hypothetical protein